MKSERECMDIVNTYVDLGSYRATGDLCGIDHKTVKRVVQRWRAGTVAEPRMTPARGRNTDCVEDLIWERVKKTRGRITAKRLLPQARAAGYEGSARNFRRAVAQVKTNWARSEHHRRPWVPSPGEHLVIDWGEEGRLKIFCAVLAWSRYRFVRFAPDMKRETTLRLLAECIEELGAVPHVVLSDRMGCLRAQTVANVVVPHPDYVRFATHFSFRPDFCEADDPESKGVVEALVGYAKSDLVVPSGGWDDIDVANSDAKTWSAEVNARVHTETCATPAKRLIQERGVMRALPNLRPPLRRGEIRKVDRLSTVRFGSARYSVPSALVGDKVEVTAGAREVVIFRRDEEVCRHPLVAPGEVSISDDHYGTPATKPHRAIRPRSNVERAFVSLGDVAEDFLRAAAAAGTQRLATELQDIVSLEASWGRPGLIAALERATPFRRFKAQDVRSILVAGTAPTVVTPGGPLGISVPEVATRSLDAYAMEQL
ncbi:MAG: IS21 family transposase [Actinobacteria bacterium]|nr:IS21 family transposase [Actinomycetota bacterium]